MPPPPFYSDDPEADSMSGAPETPVPESDFTEPAYDRALIETVWDYAEAVPGNDPFLWRKDEYGAWIYRSDYGKRHSEFGWEICDLSPGRGAGGLAALRPMQWQNYIDQVAALTQSRMTADGLRNVRKLI